MLKTDYKDDILNTDVNVNRKFNIVRSNGTLVEQNVELRETTVFEQEGDSFGAKDINETNEAIVDVRGQIHTNLLNPTLETTTINGVTCTNNGDGTFTLTGTATNDTVFQITNDTPLEVGKQYRLVGCPNGGGGYTYKLSQYGDSRATYVGADFGEGFTFTAQSSVADNGIAVFKNQALPSDGLTFKPMLTTDLDVTYNDYVPYSGDGRLNENVAALFDMMRPVGSLYPTTDADFNPNTAKGWHGTWERITDCVIYAAGDNDTVGQIVGSNTHTLSSSELPPHKHPIPKLTGKAKSHGISGLFAALSSTNFGIGFWDNGHSLSNYWPFSGGEANSRHEHDVETNESNTSNNATYNTPIDMRPRRLNCSIWMRTA